MRSEPQVMKEIHDIRAQIYEETRHMTAAQRADRANRVAEECAAKHGVTLLRPGDRRALHAG
jgi:acyl-CoA synthetase (AMP-forming)/AMP-acid ligase II